VDEKEKEEIAYDTKQTDIVNAKELLHLDRIDRT
jgi:hypothetical protein